ncbi:MAG: hypothetical protein IPH04_02890 [Saprospirales bacterium]|nr:hypothetical protein [Saprospirales bacterium]
MNHGGFFEEKDVRLRQLALGSFLATTADINTDEIKWDILETGFLQHANYLVP